MSDFLSQFDKHSYQKDTAAKARSTRNTPPPRRSTAPIRPTVDDRPSADGQAEADRIAEILSSLEAAPPPRVVPESPRRASFNTDVFDDNVFEDMEISYTPDELDSYSNEPNRYAGGFDSRSNEPNRYSGKSEHYSDEPTGHPDGLDRYVSETDDYPLTDSAEVVPYRERKITAPEHVVVRDTSHARRQIARIAILGTFTLIVIALIVGIYLYTTRIEIPNFVGDPIDRHRNWELTNRITLDVTNEYSLEYSEGTVMFQGQKPGTHLRRGNVIPVTVSLGPDPTEHVPLPDFAEMTTAQVRNWRSEMQVLGVNIQEEFNDEVDAGRFIRMEFVDPSLTPETFTRQDGLLVFMSRGEEVIPANIVVPNFLGRIRGEVEEWADQNDIIVTFEEEPSDTVMQDAIISQSIAPRERIAKEAEMTIVISLGPSVIVPDFSVMSDEEILAIANMAITTRERFSDTVPFGRLISQSEEAGTELIGLNPPIILVRSLGRPFIDDLVGQMESVVPEIFYRFTSRGADITYNIIYVNSWYRRGEILDVSRYNQWLSMEDHVNIWVSLGNLNPPEPPPPPPPPEPEPEPPPELPPQ